jgi:pimeloyl-ACP methyl ester carboxylesterase
MGGYGAILLAEKYPRLIAAVAAISPAIWTSYAEAQSANAGAYASAADFAADDAVTHAAALARIPVSVASGYEDPFYSGVQALTRALPKTAETYFGSGCHTDASSTPRNHRPSRSWPVISPHRPQGKQSAAQQRPGPGSSAL